MATDARLLSLWLPFCRHLQSTVRSDQPVLARGEPVLPEEPLLPTLRVKDAKAAAALGISLRRIGIPGKPRTSP